MKGGYGMKESIPACRQDNRAAGNSRQEAVVAEDRKDKDQKLLESLTPNQRELVEEVMQARPGLTVEEALAQLKAAGM